MVIHVLVHGLPVCGFSRELPCNWPIGHKWVRAEEHSDATCRRCRETALTAFPLPTRDTLPDIPVAEPEPDYDEEVSPPTDDEDDYSWGYI